MEIERRPASTAFPSAPEAHALRLL